MKSDLSTVFNLKFDDAPPLLMTKSIEIMKSDFKVYSGHILDAHDMKPRMLHTPALDSKFAKRNKVRKIPDRREEKKTTTINTAAKVILNPSINFKHGIAPALMPSMLNLVRANKNRHFTPM